MIFLGKFICSMFFTYLLPHDSWKSGEKWWLVAVKTLTVKSDLCHLVYYISMYAVCLHELRALAPLTLNINNLACIKWIHHPRYIFLFMKMSVTTWCIFHPKPSFCTSVSCLWNPTQYLTKVSITLLKFRALIAACSALWAEGEVYFLGILNIFHLQPSCFSFIPADYGTETVHLVHLLINDCFLFFFLSLVQAHLMVMT